MADARPNIICFVTDQHRADHLGCYGNAQVRTPSIDRLAAEGVTFTESYVANPVCMPDRASMFTGRYPKAHGVRENGHTLSTDEVILPEVLRSAGYQTISVGKIHLAPFDMKPELADHERELYESHRWWAEGGELPLPYYGLERVWLVDGHGPYAFGDYKRWLESEHPGKYAKLQPDAALFRSGARQCWHTSIDESMHYNTYVADRSIEALLTRDPRRPFFLWCSFPDPHHPFSPPKPYCDWYDPDQVDFRPARREGEFDDLPSYFGKVFRGEMMTGGTRGNLSTISDRDYREIIALTYGMVSMVDVNVGRVMAALEEMALLDNTVVVFFSDHGDLMGDHWLINKGPFLYRGLVRVPTVWRVPGGVKGALSPEMVSTVDLCPTLLDLAGVPAPEGVQGSSYRDVLQGESAGGRDSVYIEYDESYLQDRLRQIRTRDFALTFFADSDRGMLFDLRRDPDELVNIWDDPAYRSTKRDLMCELLQFTVRADNRLPPKKVHA